MKYLDLFELNQKIEIMDVGAAYINETPIYSSLINENLEKSMMEFSGKNFSDFKEKLSQVLVEKIMPISNEIKKLLEEKEYLDTILLKGSEKADKIASKKVNKIHEIVGF